MQNFNYHTHTYRCGHATGEDEEYIKNAIKGGFKTLGFSEHLGYQGWDDKKERIDFNKVDTYIRDMYALKEKYKNQIDLKIGFEFEYFEDHEEYLKSIYDKVDYMIIGQHAKNFNMYYEHGSTDDDIDVYASQICKALDLGLTKYVAHIDYFMLGLKEFSEQNAKAIEKICDAVLRNDAYIEVNIKGSKYGKKLYNGIEQYIYPHYDVYKIVAQKGCKVVFGYDAHSPDALLEREKEIALKEEFKNLNLNYQDSIIL
ncbi:histidinol-phosphatase (PHP family) [Breznakia sp. PF5-3]|uniref:PHP domain-containing protein n=1 Tax=unclassified Breznakia TaxID=2623764 RepID=UPI002404CE5D|nr:MULTISPECIES: PHP domain-containing protein [unclassified Breznakia]MDF9825646.1 histidinol-phosphatase (PHP family) [Breznakia sp. PM6-1]MDF9836484.1 histidinol-phosphatase (PHP family) [Breznakia sp. PF5-3]MDF9838671.1 histidinol-phosphatase (PHP family) [Breznakia sp. PFB2-8]MDF9860704.1 histidinol-phosphatase (PHP family) [Breznakia sp. PH5-24]